MSSRELVFVGWGLSRERSEEKRRSAISSLLLPPYFHLGDLFSTTSAKVSYQQSIWTSATCLPAAWFVRRQCEMPNRYSRSSGFVSVFLVSNETALKKVFQLRGSRRKHGVATPVFPWSIQIVQMHLIATRNLILIDHFNYSFITYHHLSCETKLTTPFHIRSTALTLRTLKESGRNLNDKNWSGANKPHVQIEALRVGK